MVHCKREPYDVYIGRPGPWGNPFMIGTDGDRETVIKKFELWLQEDDDAVTLRERLGELRDKVLGCYCAPNSCHGDVLARMADEDA